MECQQGQSPSGTGKSSLPSPSFWAEASVPAGPQVVARHFISYFRHHICSPVSPCCDQISSSYKDTSHIGLESPLLQYEFVITEVVSAKEPLFQIAHVSKCRFGTSTHILENTVLPVTVMEPKNKKKIIHLTVKVSQKGTVEYLFFIL